MKGYLQTKTIFPPAIFRKPSLNVGLIVVIPACNEPFLLLSLLSLKKCHLPKCDVEVIVVINDSEKADDTIKNCNKETFSTTLEWAKKNSSPRLKFHILYFNELPAKKAGVGLARKIGMDEACWRFEKARNPNGIIACFDADSKCDPTYFQALEDHFENHRKTVAASIYFEHPLAGPDFPEQQYEAITLYELHLRYIIEAQRWAGFPFAFHTVGSSMAVKWEAYIKQGGMNTRLAGEDFYFLQKFIQLDKLTEINNTRVVLSPRSSGRVPFGTGKVVQEILKTKSSFKTYHPEGFKILKSFFEKVGTIYSDETNAFLHLHSSLQAFLKEEHFFEKMEEIKGQSKNLESFRNQFYKWFNTVQLLNFLDHHRQYQADIDVFRASLWLIDQYEDMLQAPTDGRGALHWFRARQRSGVSQYSTF